MSNSQLDVLVVAWFVAHFAALCLAVFLRRGRPAVIWFNGFDAALALAWLAIHPQWFRPPPDWQVIAWALFELAALGASILALRAGRAWIVAAWVAFSVHGLASALAALFALTFKITRLF